MSNTLRSISWSLAGIIVCGVGGAVCAWWLVDALGLSKLPAALVGVIAGMLFATASFAALTSFLRKLGVLK